MIPKKKEELRMRMKQERIIVDISNVFNKAPTPCWKSRSYEKRRSRNYDQRRYEKN